MKISTIKEIKTHEYRVGITPHGARALVLDGHEVLIEEEAGAGAGFTDAEYVAAGARIVDVDEAWASDLLVKVKEPVATEFSRLRDDLTLFTYLHLAADRQLTEALVESGTTAIAYETVTGTSSRLPLLTPMSEVAGRLAPQMGAQALERHRGGAGLLLGGIPGVAPARVVVLGGGVVGFNAALIAMGMRAEVTVLDANIERVRELDELFAGSVRVLLADPTLTAQLVAEADMVIGAVLVPGALAPRLVTRAQLSTMRPGSVLVDVAIDQGGCFETSRATTHDEPSYIVDGIVHYCVANMPGAVPRTSTIGLTNVTIPHVRNLANRGVGAALAADPSLATGLNVAGGTVTHRAVADTFGMSWVPASVVFSAAEAVAS